MTDKLYTVANNYICRDRPPDGPCKINHKRTVEDACPYGGIIIYITDKLHFTAQKKQMHKHLFFDVHAHIIKSGI